MPPGLDRLVLRELAGRAAGRPVPMSRSRTAQISRLAADPEGGEIELGGGVLAVCEGGRVRFTAAADRGVVAAVRLPIPGRADFAGWELRAEVIEGPPAPAGPEVATLDAAKVGSDVEVRSWRDGDRIRPLGLGGSKSLQDLFTDGRVPRSQRRSVPVVTSGGRVAWVPGLAVGEEFRLDAGSRRAAVLRATAPRGMYV